VKQLKEFSLAWSKNIYNIFVSMIDAHFRKECMTGGVSASHPLLLILKVAFSQNKSYP
jgi:hypothetical protein